MLSFLYVYSDHSILECYNLFSGVELSMRSFFVIIIIIIAWGGQTSTTSYNIPENKRNVVSYNICLVKKFDPDQTSYNKIQHDTTGWPNECNISYNIKLYDVV